MASWRNFFSGVTLNNKSMIAELGEKWWTNVPRKPSIVTMPRLQEPERVIEGTISQGFIEGKYAGTQCTSICLEAICWWMTEAKCGDFTEVSVDYVNYSGHYLHLHFRDDLVLSISKDKRVSIDDLPAYCRTGSGIFYNNRPWQEYVTIPPYDPYYRELRSLRDYLLSCTSKPFGVLITIGEFTQAIMYNTKKKWLVFDSHGYLSFFERFVQHASCWVFSNVDAVITFLCKIRYSDGYCMVAKPTIMSADCFACSQREAELKARKLGKKFGKAAMSAPCPEKSSKFEFDDDPYVSLMGGFGC